jgi:electron transport complex protein RnfB
MPAAVDPALITRLDEWLPQTQCTQCGYPRCRAYAEALAEGRADINRCPPGGEVTIAALAGVLGVAPKSLDPSCGEHKPRVVTVIDENACIGCRKCLDVCPVDAILGARKLLHTVLATECNGCGLCVPPCPVDCIALVPNHTGYAQSAFGSDHRELPFPASGRGVGERVPSPIERTARAASIGSLPSPSGRRDGDEGAGTGSVPAGTGDGGEGAWNRWPEYSLEETAHWRARTEARLARLLRRRPREPRRTIFPDADTIRADLRAALARAAKKKAERSSPR